MTIHCRNPHLILKEEMKEPSKIALAALHVQPGVLKHFPIQIAFSHAASGQTWVLILTNVNSSLGATLTTQLTQGR